MAYQYVQFIAHCINTAPAYIEEKKMLGLVKDDKRKYVGIKESVETDIKARVAMVKRAILMAQKEADSNDNILKVFMIPEFFFRGPNGAYTFDETFGIKAKTVDDEKKENEDESKDKGSRGVVDQLQDMVYQLKDSENNENWKNWVFVFGSIVTKLDVTKQTKKKNDGGYYETFNVTLVQRGGFKERKLAEKTAKVIQKEFRADSDFIAKKELVKVPNERKKEIVVFERVVNPPLTTDQRLLEGALKKLIELSDEELKKLNIKDNELEIWNKNKQQLKNKLNSPILKEKSEVIENLRNNRWPKNKYIVLPKKNEHINSVIKQYLSSKNKQDLLVSNKPREEWVLNPSQRKLLEYLKYLLVLPPYDNDAKGSSNNQPQLAKVERKDFFKDFKISKNGYIDKTMKYFGNKYRLFNGFETKFKKNPNIKEMLEYLLRYFKNDPQLQLQELLTERRLELLQNMMSLGNKPFNDQQHMCQFLYAVLRRFLRMELGQEQSKIFLAKAEALGDYSGTSVFTLKEGITFGVELCLDHHRGRLKNSKNLPPIDVQLIPSCGISIITDAAVARPGGYVFNCDGNYQPSIDTASENEDKAGRIRFDKSGKILLDKSGWGSHSNVFVGNTDEKLPHYSSLPASNYRPIQIETDPLELGQPISAPVKIEEIYSQYPAKNINPQGAGSLHIYEPQRLPMQTFVKGKSIAPFSHSHAWDATPASVALSDNNVVLNGMKVIFDKAVPVSPVSLVPKRMTRYQERKH